MIYTIADQQNQPDNFDYLPLLLVCFHIRQNPTRMPDDSRVSR